MDKKFRRRLAEGNLLFVIKKEPHREFVIELLKDVENPECYCPVRYLYRNKSHVSLIGGIKGKCFLPCCSDLFDTYIITEEY